MPTVNDELTREEISRAGLPTHNPIDGEEVAWFPSLPPKPDLTIRVSATAILSGTPR